MALVTPASKLFHKELLLDHGFLVYMTWTYPAMVPYLKGYHLMIEMWQGGQDADGWKLKEGDDLSIVSLQLVSSLDVSRAGAHGMDLNLGALYSLLLGTDENEATINHQLGVKLGNKHLYAPQDRFTKLVPRLKGNIKALQQLTKFVLPPLWVLRPAQVVHVYYGFGDASVKQFGVTLLMSYNYRIKLGPSSQDARGIQFRVELWSAAEETESSNYKELRNLVDTVLEVAKARRMRDCEFFLFTDNLTTEGCFY
jgi:hypothetical protein